MPHKLGQIDLTCYIFHTLSYVWWPTSHHSAGILYNDLLLAGWANLTYFLYDDLPFTSWDTLRKYCVSCIMTYLPQAGELDLASCTLCILNGTATGLVEVYWQEDFMACEATSALVIGDKWCVLFPVQAFLLHHKKASKQNSHRLAWQQNVCTTDPHVICHHP